MTESMVVSDVLILLMTREVRSRSLHNDGAEYVKIFKTIGCEGAAYYSPGSKVKASFSMWSVGMLFAGQDKSIMLFPGDPPTPIVETTDGYRWTQMDHQRGAWSCIATSTGRGIWGTLRIDFGIPDADETSVFPHKCPK